MTYIEAYKQLDTIVNKFGVYDNYQIKLIPKKPYDYEYNFIITYKQGTQHVFWNMDEHELITYFSGDFIVDPQVLRKEIYIGGKL